MLASEEEEKAKHKVQGGGERRKGAQGAQHTQPRQEGDTELEPEEVHVHVECKHGFALISGTRDGTLQPACYKEKCREDGERWLKNEGLVAQSSATWAPPTGVPSLRGERREQFLQDCDAWYRSNRGQNVPCKIIEPSCQGGRSSLVRFWCKERVVPQIRLTREATAAKGPGVIFLEILFWECQKYNNP